MLRLLHTADWQIGRVFRQFEADDAAALGDARFAAVARLADLASREQVDAVLVAGDVFDLQTVSDKTIRKLFNTLAGFAGPWFLLPGNHDAGLVESVWARAHRLGVIPANVTACLEARPHELPGRGVILPAPLTQRHTYEDLTAWFDGAATPEGLPRIGMAHGAVQGVLPEAVDSPNPIASQRAQSARLDYLALGDWHGTFEVNERCWYSGTPEPDRFTGNDPGHALLVSVAGPGALPRVETVRTASYTWVNQQHRLVGPSDVDMALAAMQSLDAQHVAQVSISGIADLAGHERLARASADLQARVRGLVWKADDLQLQPTDEDMAAIHADGYLGEVVRQLRDQQQGGGAEAERAKDALLVLAQLLGGTGAAKGPAASSTTHAAGAPSATANSQQVSA